MLDDALFRAMCDETPDAVFVKDAAGRYLYANAAAAALLDTTPAQLVGTDDDRWFGPVAGAAIRAYDAEVRAANHPRTDEQERLIAGERRYFATTKSPYRSPPARCSASSGSRAT